MSLISRDSLFDFDRFFDQFYPSSQLKSVNADFFKPHIDVKEKKDSYEITADLPGVKKENIAVSVDNGILKIEANTEEEKTEEEEGKVIYKERRSGKFLRSFNLGANVSQGDIKAGFENGVLKLSVPKVNAAIESSRKIAIE